MQAHIQTQPQTQAGIEIERIATALAAWEGRREGHKLMRRIERWKEALLAQIREDLVKHAMHRIIKLTMELHQQHPRRVAQRVAIAQKHPIRESLRIIGSFLRECIAKAYNELTTYWVCFVYYPFLEWVSQRAGWGCNKDDERLKEKEEEWGASQLARYFPEAEAITETPIKVAGGKITVSAISNP